MSRTHEKDVTWRMLKSLFNQWFKDTHTDQYHFMQLQTARQEKNESPQQFADRCRALSQKIICKTSDPVAQRIHRENAERMLLASFIAGLMGAPGKQVRYASPRDRPCQLHLRFRKPKNKSDLMKPSTRNLIIQTVSEVTQLVCHRMTICLGAHLTCQRSNTCVVGAQTSA